MSEGNELEIPAMLPYHPDSELLLKSGYYPNLTMEHLFAVENLKSLLNEANLKCVHTSEYEPEFLRLLRFLRARQFDVEKAFDMLKEDIEWRETEDLYNLKYQAASDVLNCDLKEMFRYFPTWVQGYDKQLRPIAWRQFGKFEIWNVLKITTMEKLVRFHAWEAEQALRLMHEQTLKTGYNIETFVIVIDAAGWNLGLATSDALTFIKGMAYTDSLHYPERLGLLIIINAPYVISFTWNIIKTFLDEVTKNKIQIHSTQSTWFPVLCQYIDVDQIPQAYGGSAMDLNENDAIASMNPPPLAVTYEKSENVNDEHIEQADEKLSLAIDSVTIEETQTDPSNNENLNIEN
jgi:hypothetical protein